MIKRLLVPDQNANNMFKMTAGDSGCCGDSVTDCQYTATYTQANTTTLLNITEDGATRALPLVLGANSTPAQVKAAILAALVAAGYEDDDNATFPGVVVTDLGTTLQIVITGNVVVVSLVASGGTSTFDADCSVENLCTFAITGYAGGTTATAATNLRINGGDHNLGTITPGTTTAGDVATAVQSAMTAAGVAGTAAVTTTGSGGSQTYNITITVSEAQNTYVLAGTYLTRSACAPLYVD